MFYIVIKVTKNVLTVIRETGKKNYVYPCAGKRPYQVSHIFRINLFLQWSNFPKRGETGPLPIPFYTKFHKKM